MMWKFTPIGKTKQIQIFF